MTVTAEPTVDRLDDMAGEGGRNDGVDCVAALLEHPCPGLCFLDVATRDDAAFGDDLFRLAAPVVAAACIRGDTIATRRAVAPGQAGRLAEEVEEGDVDGAEHAQMCTRR